MNQWSQFKGNKKLTILMLSANIYINKYIYIYIHIYICIYIYIYIHTYAIHVIFRGVSTRLH